MQPKTPLFQREPPFFRNMLDNAPRRPRSPGPGFCMSRKPPVLGDFRRIVVKVGSSLVVDAGAGRLNQAWLASLAADIAGLHGKGGDVLVVSSGAIALGRSVLKLQAALKLEDSQAAAAVGQIALARTWSELLGAHSISTGQILLTLGDTEERRRYLNARSTLNKLLEWRAVPVINENDTVATDEIEAMAGAPGSDLSRGGMHTKIEAGKIATAAGAHMVIAPGAVDNPLQAIAAGGPCTWFLAPGNPVTARKKWIAGSLEPRGNLFIDAGAVAALRSGKSLLPAGVKRVEGEFSRGDAVVIRDLDGHEIGRGLSAYDASDAARILGKSSGDIVAILGFGGRAEMIHRDDLVLRRE